VTRRTPVPLLVVVVGALALARLTVTPYPWGPLVVTALVGAVVAAVVRVRFGSSAGLAAGAVAVLLSALWTVVPGATRFGLPTWTTLRVVHTALRAGRPVLDGGHAPFAATTGVVLLGAVAAGVAGAVSGVVDGAPSLLPALALVTLSAVLDRSAGAAVLVLAVVVFGVEPLLVPGRSRRSGAVVAAGALLAGALCVVAVASVEPPEGGGSAGAAGPAVAPTVLNLVADLPGLEARDPDLVLFSAVTPVATYWQVATLTVLNGGSWRPDAATAAALSGRGEPVPPGLVVRPAARSFGATVTVGALSSRLLPAPPGAVASDTGDAATALGVVAASPSTPGERYRVSAPVPGTAPWGTPVGPGEAAADTELAPLPPAVVALAHHVTAGATTPLAEAEALTGWFRSGRFRYSLTARPGSLVHFLTVTRAGSCQQFAGAYALLARAVGLPSRVAIGFTTGRRDPAGTTVVRGVDAHAWPEVDVGGSWVSFEPTPQHPSGEVTPSGVVGPSGVGGPSPGPTRPAPTGLSLPSPVRPPAPAPVPAPPAGGPWWVVAVVVGAVLAAALAAGLWWRRRRPGPPEARIERSWARVERALRRRGMERPPWRTPTAHVRTLPLTARRDPAVERVVRDLETVAALHETVAYSPDPVRPADGDSAETAAARAVRGLARVSKA